ncbi:MAG: four helix bundle protein [bacterium]
MPTPVEPTKVPLRLGDLLIRYNLIKQEQLNAALLEQKTTKKRLGAILIDKGIVTEDAINYVLSEQLNITYIQLTPDMVDPAVVPLIPLDILEKYQAVPLLQVENELTIAMIDPTDQEAINEFINITGCRILPAIALSSAIKRVIEEVFCKRKVRHQIGITESFDFEQLKVYQSALELTDQIIKMTNTFPVELQSSLGQPLRDTSVSLLTNIAQGDIEQAKYSLKKCIPLLMLSSKNTLIEENVHNGLRKKCLEICSQLEHG